MKIGILGSGIVGQTLAKGFKKEGYEIILGTNNLDKKKELEKNLENIKIENFKQTAKKSDLLILAVKGAVSEKVIEDLKDDLDDKIILDATNPISDKPIENGVLSFFTTLEKSLMERLQNIAPKANFVKAFNSVGNAFMIHPKFNGIKPTMFICGNNSNAKEKARKLIEQVGFEVEDMGMVESARAIEPLCILWCIPGFIRNEWNHAFKLLKN